MSTASLAREYHFDIFEFQTRPSEGDVAKWMTVEAAGASRSCKSHNVDLRLVSIPEVDRSLYSKRSTRSHRIEHR